MTRRLLGEFCVGDRVVSRNTNIGTVVAIEGRFIKVEFHSEGNKPVRWTFFAGELSHVE